MQPQLIEARETVAMFDLAGFTRSPTIPLTPVETIASLASYLEIVIGHIESSGGKAEHMHGNGVIGFWPLSASRPAKEDIGRAVVAILAEVSALHLGGVPCVPAVGVESGLVLRSVLQISGKMLPVSISAALNRAMRLSALCASKKKKILFSAELPVVWPSGVTAESVETVMVKGMVEPLHLMTLSERRP